MANLFLRSQKAFLLSWSQSLIIVHNLVGRDLLDSFLMLHGFVWPELVSAACVVHTLREVSFHVRLPAILLPHMAEVSICNVS